MDKLAENVGSSEHQVVTMSVTFNHNELEVAEYSGDLAAYAIGRLLVRLEWHLKQAVLLSPGPLPEIGDSSLSDLLLRHNPDKQLDSWVPEVERLGGRMESDVARHLTAVHRGLEVLPRLVRQLPIFRSLIVAADFDRKLRGLIERAISRETASQVADANVNYRGCCELPAQEEQDFNARDREFRQENNQLLVERVVKKPLSPLTADFYDRLDDQQRHLFTLGSSLEESLCPPDVHYRLAAPSPRAFLEGRGRQREPLIDRVGRWLIAFERREVGELRPRPDWLSRLRMDLIVFAGDQDEDVEQLIRCTQLKYDERTLDHEQLVDFVERIHSSVMRQFRGDKGGGGGNGDDNARS